MRRKILRKRKVLAYLIICFIILLVFFISLMERYTEQFAHFTPNYEKIDIAPILNKSNLSQEDYSTLFKQTGLGEYAIDTFRKQPDYIENILPYQDAFFQPINIRCERIGITTKQESIINEEGDYHYGFPLAPIEDGFVLASQGAHTFGWRNGHIGMVVDSENNISLESITFGVNSEYIDINNWRIYPSFLLLRLKDADSSKLSQISKNASKYLYNIPYRLTPGIFSQKYSDIKTITGTHCSHLVWESFRSYGYDVDSDGGRIVTVKDIVKNPLFEIVQIYGVNPENIWE